MCLKGIQNLSQEHSLYNSIAFNIPMKIDRAEKDHFDDIIALFRSVARDMNEKGFMQWGEDYPRVDMIESHLEDRDLWIMTEGDQILATILITPKQDKEYLDVPWEDRDGKPVVIHRLAVKLSYQGKGYAEEGQAQLRGEEVRSDFGR